MCDSVVVCDFESASTVIDTGASKVEGSGGSSLDVDSVLVMGTFVPVVSAEVDAAAAVVVVVVVIAVVVVVVAIAVAVVVVVASDVSGDPAEEAVASVVP
jgi:hypothetical protein